MCKKVKSVYNIRKNWKVLVEMYKNNGRASVENYKKW